MKRILVRAATPAVLLVLAGVASTASFVSTSCLPSPDISGLPPYEGGAVSNNDAAPITIPDGGADSAITLDSGPVADTGLVDSSLPLGSISGVVVDYTQGNGQGVLPGASVSYSLPGNTSFVPPGAVTTDVNGAFTITGVPAGQVEITVTKATPAGGSTGTAYSSTDLLVTVVSGQTLSVSPVIHEGCYQVVSVLGEDGGEDSGAPITLNGACGRQGAYAALTFDPTAFINPVTGAQYTGQVRVEMIPLAFPTNGAGFPDLSWVVGLPGQASPLDLLGAAEYRVFAVNPGMPDDGVALAIRTAVPSPVSIAVPLYVTPAATPTASAFSVSSGQWSGQASVAPSGAMTVFEGAYELEYVTMAVPNLGWWAATAPATATGCVTGSLHASGVGVPNVLVHAVGANVLGSSTATTGASGTFCVDIQALSEDGGASSVTLSAGYVSGGVAYVASGVTTALSMQASGSCSSGTGCTVLSAPVTLAPAGTCVSGDLLLDAGALPPVLNVVQTSIAVTASQSAAGISTSAYLGQVTPSTAGAFCALAPAGAAVQLQEPGNPDCYAPFTSVISVPQGASAPLCSAGGCTDAGSGILYGCPE